MNSSITENSIEPQEVTAQRTSSKIPNIEK